MFQVFYTVYPKIMASYSDSSEENESWAQTLLNWMILMFLI